MNQDRKRSARQKEHEGIRDGRRKDAPKQINRGGSEGTRGHLRRKEG